MRAWIDLFEDVELVSNVEARGFHSGQEDLTLKFSVGSNVVGWIDFVLFNNEVSVQMIHTEPQYRRKGFGTVMLRNLQHRYPDVELDLGMLTDDGAALVGSMKTRAEPNENIAELQAEKRELQAKITSYHDMHDKLMSRVGEPSFDRLRDKFINDVADWNDCHDRIAEIDDEIGNREPMKRIFEGVDFSDTNPNVVTVYHGSEKAHNDIHDGQFFTSDPKFADSYGKNIRKFRLNMVNFSDSLDEELITPLLPLYDPYTDSDVMTWSDYEDRSSDTWEIIEDRAADLVAENGTDGIIIYEGGVKNFMVFNTRCLKEITDA